MDKKKILIVTRVIFPVQNPRSFRSTELAVQFAKMGHDVVIYGILGSYSYKKWEEQNQIRIKNIPGLIFYKYDSDGKANMNFFNRAFTKLFERYLAFPDIALSLCLPKIIRNEKDIDLLITIAEPFALHWGAALAKVIHNSKFPKVWIADCGDPYMGNSSYTPPFYFEYLEKWALGKADKITIPIKGAMDAYYKELHHKIFVVPQGFDFEEKVVKPDYIEKQPITFGYAGKFYDKIRDPYLLLEYLSQLDIDFKFVIYTKDVGFVKPFMEELKGKLEIRSYIPRVLLLTELSKLDFLINIENKSTVQSPSKLIDYALTKRPILNINSSELDRSMVDDFLSRDYSKQFLLENLQEYNIINVANKFLDLTT